MKFHLPETLPTDLGELAALKEHARAELSAWLASPKGQLTAEDAERIEYLTNSITTIDGAADAITAKEAEDAERISDVLARAEAAATPKPPAVAEPETPAAPEPAPEAVAEVVAEAEQVAAGAVTVDAVTAATSKAIEFTTGGNLPVDLPSATPDSDLGWRMLPSAANFTPELAGRPVTFAEIAESIASVSKSGSGIQRTGTAQLATGETLHQQSFAVLRRPSAPVVNDQFELARLLDNLTIPGQGKVTTKALTAAGGWCAPSERTYDFCDVPEATELLSLPEFTLSKRGGIIWPNEPDISALLKDDSFMWDFTEPQLIQTDAQGKPTAIKPIPEVPCPPVSTEVRLGVIGWAFKAGILQAQAWPELIEWWLKTFTAAWLRAISRKSIAKMVAGSRKVVITAGGANIAATSATLNALSLQAQNLRLAKGYPQNYPVEMAAPVWFRDVIRADLAMREESATLFWSDKAIQSLFTDRNIFPQFVADWQTRGPGQPGHPDTKVYPKTIDVLMYPAGTWVRHLNNVITLGAMYPLEQLTVNRYTHQFIEDAFQVFKRCNDSIVVTVPTCITGAYGAPVAVACA